MLAFCKRLLALFRAARLERDLEEEIASHLAMQEEEFRQRGMSPQAARAAARREFGGVAQTAELYREHRGLPWLETAVRDVRYALRGLARNPGFTTAAVLSLALGIGANTAIFSMYHALLLRLLPVAHPEELVTLYRTGGWGRGIASYPLYLEIGRRSDLFSGVAGRASVEKVSFRAGDGGLPETAQAELVTGNYFAVLGIAPALGRLFTEDDNRIPHAHPLAVLSFDFWRRRFGGDPTVLGRSITAGQDQLTVIGVAARGFQGVEIDHRPDFWEPAMMTGNDVANAGDNWLWILGRRRPDVSVHKVQAAMDVLLRQHLAANYGSLPANSAFGTTAMTQHIEVRKGGVGLSAVRESFARPLLILLIAVGLVLLAACANVANLLLARGAGRQKEIAVRLSLGATRARLMRQAFTESLLLALSGSLLAILLAWWGESGILRFLPATAGKPFDATPDATALIFTIAIAVSAAVLFGLVPAWRVTAVDPAQCIKSAGSQAGRGNALWRQTLVVAQVAFSVMLVALAGLFGHSLIALRSVDLGFQNASVLALDVEMPASWKPDKIAAAREALLARMAAQPGTSLVSFGSPGPFRGGSSSMSLRVLGSDMDASWVSAQQVAPRYFEILGSAPLMGREFVRTDTAAAPPVAVVNQAFLRAFLPGELHPLSRTLNFNDTHLDPVTIVGVVRDIPHQGLRQKVQPTVYVPAAQVPPSFGAVLLRSERPPEDLARIIRREVEALGPDVSVSDPKTIRQRIEESIFQDRLMATVGGFFGALALLLAAIGLYGVIAYSAARRAREIGIRIAMGAKRGAVLWMVLRGSLALVTAGLAVGVPISLLAARKLTPVLFAIPPDDSITFVTTAIVLLAVGMAAAFLPARRAASLDPMRVLRQE